MTTLDTTLSFPDPSQPRFYRIRLEGRRLIRTAWADGGRPRETVKDLEVSDDFQAELAFANARDKKLREGFCRVAEVAGAARGETVLEFLVPNRCSADAFDLSPDGRTLVIGTTLKEAFGAEIHLVDIATGHRRLLHAEPSGNGQTFLHTALFDADGERIIYALNGETRLLDPATGRQRTLAAYREFKDARFNPFCVRPMWNRARTRLLVFDAGDMVRVLDADGSVLWETCIKAGTTECRAGALSPSGRLLALYRPSRGVVYHHQDALHDTTNEIEVWDLATGRLTARIPVPAPLRERQLHKIGFDPTESLIVTNPDPVQGPCALSIETGQVAWHFPDAYRTDRWETCYGWDFSPDGATLAIGRRADTDVVDTATRVADPAFKPSWPETGTTGRTNRVRISDDGTLVASGGDSGRILVRKL